jgi:hypothetical protein
MTKSIYLFHECIIQEHLSEKQGVSSSILPLTTKLFNYYFENGEKKDEWNFVLGDYVVAVLVGPLLTSDPGQQAASRIYIINELEINPLLPENNDDIKAHSLLKSVLLHANCDILSI